MHASPSLPLPSVDEELQSAKLLAQIMGAIQNAQGQLPFSEFMRHALYAPGLGYYNQPQYGFKNRQEFITAPMVSSLFSGCLANTCIEVLEKTGGNILEIGAGLGHMAGDILKRLNDLNALPEHYYIYEQSEFLRKTQQEKLASLDSKLYSRIVWLEDLNLDNLNLEPFEGVILANEVLDAMPVCRFKFNQGRFFESFVIANEPKRTEGFEGVEGFERSLTEIFLPSSRPEFQSLPLMKKGNLEAGGEWEDYVSEINLNIRPWLKTLTGLLKRGVILLIDYGFPETEYYHPERNQGTLMCHYQRFAHHNPFFYPGLQDITAHVDFTAVARSSEALDLDILGYTNQASFLIHSGLIPLLEEQHFETDAARFKAIQGVQCLTSPAEMGELFKVLGLGKDFPFSISGFKFAKNI